MQWVQDPLPTAPNTVSAGQWSREVCKLALNSGLSCLRPGSAQRQSDPWVWHGFQARAGPCVNSVGGRRLFPCTWVDCGLFL